MLEEIKNEEIKTTTVEIKCVQDEIQRANAAVSPDVLLLNDPALLLVRGKNGENKQYIKSLSHAIMTVIGKHGYASLKCVGAASVNNAVKSFAIAAVEAKTHGLNLVLTAGFQNAMFDDVEKTAMVFKIFDR